LVIKSYHGNDDAVQKYHRYGNEVSLAMSADATCRGLRSATDGPFLMQLTRGKSRILIKLYVIN